MDIYERILKEQFNIMDSVNQDFKNPDLFPPSINYIRPIDFKVFKEKTINKKLP